ncbi:MAG TPA: hypothetical protein VFJ81_16670 [Gemmatimonadales bacterium]|nr:hypothetical protein [Gemmatimonadales bacterium]
MSSLEQPQGSVGSAEQRIEERDAAGRKVTLATGQGDLQVEELEERIAPRLAANHNESVLS